MKIKIIIIFAGLLVTLAIIFFELRERCAYNKWVDTGSFFLPNRHDSLFQAFKDSNEEIRCSVLMANDDRPRIGIFKNLKPSESLRTKYFSVTYKERSFSIGSKLSDRVVNMPWYFQSIYLFDEFDEEDSERINLRCILKSNFKYTVKCSISIYYGKHDFVPMITFYEF